MSTITVRPATLADLTTLRLFWRALCHEQGFNYPSYDDDDTARWTADMALRLEVAETHPEIGTWIALDRTGVPVGFLTGRLEHRTVGMPRSYWIADHLYVVPEARGFQRVGAALMRAGVEHAMSHGAEVLELVAMANDPQWAKRGWTPVMTRYTTPVARVWQQLAPRRGGMH